MESIFTKSRDVFLDTINAKDYIQLDRVSTIYEALKESLRKPLKMVLLFGKPGSGKSMLLAKLYDELSEQNNIYLYQTPIVDENEFYKILVQDIFQIKYDGTLNFTQFMKITRDSVIKEVPIVLLDEAQLYAEPLLEKIRLLSDTRSIKFVITLHKTEKEDLIAKEHFQTRIWETFELENASNSELKIYIQKKLMKANCFDTANMFTPKIVDTIYKLTQGNYRETNKLLYTLFDIYSTYEKNMPNYPLNTVKIPKKFVEMAAIHTGLINA
ncbi:MAG TPA: ATP-binding protein [Sulfurimonas autotrophica]|nr:ATP-binding protein [Sulfurimonas autotrophica]